MNKHHHIAMFFSLLIISLPFQVFADAQTSESNQKSHNTAKIQWADRCAREGSVSIIRVIDENMNNDSNAKEHFDIEIWSDSDHKSIKKTVIETGVNTGIFEGTVFFYKYEERSPHRIKAFAGDNVYDVDVQVKPHTEKTDEAVMIVELPIREWPYGKSSSAITYEPCTKSIIKKILEEPSIQREIFFPSPLKQIQSGLYLEEIQCKSELQKMTKHDGTIACVTYQTSIKLLERGWTLVENDSNKIGQEIGYITLYMIFLIADSDQSIPIDLEGPHNQVKQMIERYDISVMSSKTSDGDGLFSSNFWQHDYFKLGKNSLMRTL